MATYKLILISAQGENPYVEFAVDSLKRACEIHVETYKKRITKQPIAMVLPDGSRHSYFDSEKLAA